jgi:hypothetical protein
MLAGGMMFDPPETLRFAICPRGVVNGGLDEKYFVAHGGIRPLWFLG